MLYSESINKFSKLRSVQTRKYFSLFPLRDVMEGKVSSRGEDDHSFQNTSSVCQRIDKAILLAYSYLDGAITLFFKLGLIFLIGCCNFFCGVKFQLRVLIAQLSVCSSNDKCFLCSKCNGKETSVLNYKTLRSSFNSSFNREPEIIGLGASRSLNRHYSQNHTTDIKHKLVGAIPKFVKIVEVGPRDGLQNEKEIVPTTVMVELIKMLVSSGLSVVEATNFVSPKWVPQLADAKDVISAIQGIGHSRFPVLTPNLKGFEAAMAAGAKEVAVFAAASESFSRSNINCSIDDSLAQYRQVALAAKNYSIPVRGYVERCIGSIHSPLDLTEDEWDDIIRTNLKGTWLVSKYVCGRMRDAIKLQGGRDGGSIINIFSIAGPDRGHLPSALAYAASRTALNTVTKNFQVYAGVVGVCPINK